MKRHPPLTVKENKEQRKSFHQNHWLIRVQLSDKFIFICHKWQHVQMSLCLNGSDITVSDSNSVSFSSSIHHLPFHFASNIIGYVTKTSIQIFHLQICLPPYKQSFYRYFYLPTKIPKSPGPWAHAHFAHEVIHLCIPFIPKKVQLSGCICWKGFLGFTPASTCLGPYRICSNTHK